MNADNRTLYFLSVGVFGIVVGLRGMYWLVTDGISSSVALLVAGCLAILVGVAVQWRTPAVDTPNRFAWVTAFGTSVYIGVAAVGLLW